MAAVETLTLEARVFLLKTDEALRKDFLDHMAWRQARLDFVAFLGFVQIQDVHGTGEHVEEAIDAIKFDLWPHLVERAQSWQAGTDEIVLKARQLGLSWLAAAYALFVALKPGKNVLLLSKGELEAYQLLDKVKFIWEHLPPALRLPLEVDNEGELAFQGGGDIIALPSTKDAGRGFTASLVICDEAAYHPWAVQNYKAYRPTIADGGQLIILSTANGVGGFFYDQWEKATRQQRTLRSIKAGSAPELAENAAVVRMLTLALLPVFIPWHARPDRDHFWLEKERQTYVGDPADFTAEYPATPEEAFVRLTGLVYPMFSEEKHAKPEPVPWASCHYRYAGYDLGGGDPTAIVLLGCYRDKHGYERVHQYAEYYRTTGAPTVEEMADFLLPWHENAPFTWVESDPKDAVVQESLAATGLPCRTANWERKLGLGLVAMYLGNEWLTIGEHCLNSIFEFEGYRWLTRVDPNSKDRYATGTPVDHHADGMDARRYALVGIYTDQMNARGDNWASVYQEVVL